MTEIHVVRKFNLGQHSYRMLEFHDTVTVDDPNNDDQVLEAMQQSWERIHAAWDMYRDWIEEKNGVQLPTY